MKLLDYRKIPAVSLIGLLVLILSGPSAFAQESRKEFIIFSHELHIDGMGVECMACHEDITKSKRSSDYVIPSHTECFVCHDGDTARDDCTVCHYDEINIFPSPIVERDFKFNHELHIGMENIECTTCHAGLESTDYATSENMPEMALCITCHNDSVAPQECQFCHLQPQTLRPESHIPDWIHRHDDAMRSTSEDCTICHQFNYCQECHDGAVLTSPGKGLISNNLPVGSQNWNLNNMVFQRNHSLNFVFTHPLEARNNPQRCQICHDTESFCNTCHASPDHTAEIKPDWHGGADWGAMALAVGSGGGRHGKMARQDPSLCASCHDANGEDPVCLLCHMDRNPGRNNDARFHSFNIMRTVRGPWHDDPGNTCFTCHIHASSQDPIGFCGYCHMIR